MEATQQTATKRCIHGRVKSKEESGAKMAEVFKGKSENTDDFIKVSTNSFLIDRLIDGH